MDMDRLAQLQALMKEARETGQVESALAASSVFPLSSRPARQTVPVSDFNMAKASMPKQVHVQVQQLTPKTVSDLASVWLNYVNYTGMSMILSKWIINYNP